MTLLDRIAEALQAGDDSGVAECVGEAIARGIPAREILDDALIAGMTVVGERFRTYEIFLPDVLLAARAMKAGTDVIGPLFLGGDVPHLGTVVIGTVRGDLHDIGKNLVGIMLEGAGFEVVDLGRDVAAPSFVDAAEERGASVIGMSALLTTTAPGMAEVTALLRERGLSGRVRTLVGGAPMTEGLARELGADAYAFDAAHAVGRVKELAGV